MIYGWRARLGVLIPSVVATIEPEFQKMVPEGVTCHFQRFNFTGGGIKILQSLKSGVMDAAELISHVDPSSVAMCCTAGSFAGGKGYDQGIVEKLRTMTNRPATTASTSVLEAFAALNVKKIALAVPYIEELAEAEKHFFEANGIEITNLNWLGVDGFDMNRVPYERTYDLAKKVNNTNAEAVFISCVGLPTAAFIETLENDVNKPVITSNQATLWKLLRLAKINDKIKGFGKLLTI